MKASKKTWPVALVRKQLGRSAAGPAPAANRPSDCCCPAHAQAAWCAPPPSACFLKSRSMAVMLWHCVTSYPPSVTSLTCTRSELILFSATPSTMPPLGSAGDLQCAHALRVACIPCCAQVRQRWHARAAWHRHQQALAAAKRHVALQRLRTAASPAAASASGAPLQLPRTHQRPPSFSSPNAAPYDRAARGGRVCARQAGLLAGACASKQRGKRRCQRVRATPRTWFQCRC